jgi:hypothetical protein
VSVTTAESLRRTCVEVVPGLWIGGDAADVPPEVTTVVTMEGVTPSLGLTGVLEHRYPLRDTRWEPVARGPLEAAVEVVASRSGPVLVRCRHGVNRSALVVCLALRQEGLSGAEVVEFVRTARPGVLTNPYFVDLIANDPRDPMSPNA